MFTLLFILVILSLAANVMLLTGCLNFHAEPDALEQPSPTNHLQRRTQQRKNINVMTATFLLAGANFVMALAWYGHLKFEEAPILAVILLSWLIALPEYVLLTTANRMGFAYLTASHLKALQVVLTSCAFLLFVKFYFDTNISWQQAVGLGLIICGATIILLKPRLPECPEQREVEDA